MGKELIRNPKIMRHHLKGEFRYEIDAADAEEQVQKEAQRLEDYTRVTLVKETQRLEDYTRVKLVGASAPGDIEGITDKTGAKTGFRATPEGILVEFVVRLVKDGAGKFWICVTWVVSFADRLFTHQRTTAYCTLVALAIASQSCSVDGDKEAAAEQQQIEVVSLCSETEYLGWFSLSHLDLRTTQYMDSAPLGKKQLVKKRQELLNMAGFDAGTEDGIAGPKFRAAVLGFEGKTGAELDWNNATSVSRLISLAFLQIEEFCRQNLTLKVDAGAVAKIAAQMASRDEEAIPSERVVALDGLERSDTEKVTVKVGSGAQRSEQTH